MSVDSEHELERELERFIVDEFLYGEGSLSLDQDLFATNVLDSLGVIRLIAFCGDRYGVTVDPSDITIENFETLRKTAAYVRGRT